MGYSARLLSQGSFLTRLAHRRRYKKTLDLIGEVRAATVLDFGCGDALMLRRAYDSGIAARGMAVDSSPEMRVAANRVIAGAAGLVVLSPDELRGQVESRSFDVALCCETLEHVANPEPLIDLLHSYVKPNGVVVITVPIEVGPALLGKQAGRYLAGLFGEYGYERYSPRELLSAMLGRPHVFPSSHTDPDAVDKGHKGFDFRAIERLIRKKMTIDCMTCTPFSAFGPIVNSTIMWRCRPRS